LARLVYNNAMRNILIGICFALTALLSWGQATRDPDYRLGVGDLIEVSVLGVPEYSHTMRVGNDGKILLPYVGDVDVAGKTCIQLATELQESMDGRLFRNPQVLVLMKEFRSNPIILLGAVGKPGKYEMVSQMRLIDLLIEAGGVAEDATDNLTIQRHTPDGEAEGDLININVKQLFAEGTSSPLNIPLRWGDLVTVIPKNPSDIVYILGDVGGPGVYTLPRGRKVRLTEALAAAGGTLRTANSDKSMIIRYDEEGIRHEVAFDFKKMLMGKEPDLFVEPRDIIFVPGSTAKTVGWGLLGLGKNVGTRAVTQGIIY
jgi:polysaccharide export outer membrane protein